MERRFLGTVAVALLLVCVQQAGGAGAAPLGGEAEAEAMLAWEDRATSHEHWERLVRRSVEEWDSSRTEEKEEDETADIEDVREYYRRVFAEGWDDVHERQRQEELARLLETLKVAVPHGRRPSSQEYGQPRPPARVSSQEHPSPQEAEQRGSEVNVGCLKKPIRGRYIVMFESDASDYVLDRTIEILERANVESGRRIRATDFSPIRHLRKGFVATMNAKTVGLVRGAREEAERLGGGEGGSRSHRETVMGALLKLKVTFTNTHVWDSHHSMGRG